MPKNYYHVTTRKNAEKILKEGLKPIEGNNRSLSGDERKGIFLCKRKSVPYWKTILGLDTVLQVSGIEIKEEDNYEYYSYEECICLSEIPPSQIKKVYINVPEEINHELCLGYIHSISSFTVMCARYYNGYDIEPEDIRYTADSLMKALYNLDFTAVPAKEVRAVLREGLDNGMYMLSDTYFDEGKSLWRKLREYPQDELTECRMRIYNYVRRYLKGKLNVDTGGWCG